MFSGRRARDARRKALLDGFIVAQCRCRPEVHAALAPDIREFLRSHPSAGTGAWNGAALAGFLADPGHGDVAATSADARKAAGIARTG